MTEVQFQSENDNTNQSTPEPKKEIRLPELPSSVSHPEPTAVKTVALGPVFVSKVNEANTLLDEFAKIRVANETSDTALNTSDHPDAIQYRQIKAATDSTVKALENDSPEAQQIKQLREAIAAKVKEARAVETEAHTRAQVSVVGAIVSEYNPDELSQQLNDINSVLVTMRKVLLDENPELAKWNVVDPEKATGKRGSRKSTTDTKRPRLAYIKLDGQNIVPSNGKFPTTTDLSKVIGVTDVGLINKRMFESLGGPDSIPDIDFHFTLTVNGKEHHIEARGRTAAAAEVEAA